MPKLLSAGAATASDQDQQPGVAAEHEKAAEVLITFGMSSKWVIKVLKRLPQLGILEAAGLQARIYAVAAVFGTLSAAALRSQLCASPNVLTLAPSDIAASHAWVIGLGLTRDEAAEVLGAQPDILLASMKMLRNIVRELCAHFNLNSAQLRGVIKPIAPSLSPKFMAGGFRSAVIKQLEHVIANQHRQPK